MPIYETLLMTSELLLLLCGATMYWFSPRLRRSWILGYGSPRSMVNDSTWQRANRFAGTVLALLALAAMGLHVALQPVIDSDERAQVFAFAVVLAQPFVVMYVTERHLARVFKN